MKVKLRERERNKEKREKRSVIRQDKGRRVLLGDKGRTVRGMQELPDLHAAVPIHTRSDSTVGHTLEKSASQLHIHFQFACWAMSV